MTDRHERRGEVPDDSLIEAAETGHVITVTEHDGYYVFHEEDGDVVVPMEPLTLERVDGELYLVDQATGERRLIPRVARPDRE